MAGRPPTEAQEFLRERDAPLARLDAAGSVNRQFSTLAQGWATLFLLVLRQGWPVLSLRNLVGPKPNMREAWRRQAAQDPEHFRDWAWPDHRLSLRPWAAVAIAYMGICLKDLGGFVPRAGMCAMCLLAALMAGVLPTQLLPARDARVWASRSIVVFSMLQALVTIAICDPGYYLALTDMDLLHWIAYTCIHTAASTPFFCEHLGYSVGLAVFKVVFIQILGVIAYALVERAKFKCYLELIPGDQSRARKPGAKSKVAPDSDGDVSGCMYTIAGKGVPDYMYKSSLLVLKVHVKLHCHSGPEVLSTLMPESVISLPEGVCLTEIAVRMGCICLSMDLCCSVAHAAEDRESLMARIRNAVLAWLQRSGLEGQLEDRTPLQVKVDDFMFQCTWDASNQTWSLARCGAPHQEEHYSIMPHERVAFLSTTPALRHTPSLTPSFALHKTDLSEPLGARVPLFQQEQGQDKPSSPQEYKSQLLELQGSQGCLEQLPGPPRQLHRVIVKALIQGPPELSGAQVVGSEGRDQGVQGTIRMDGALQLLARTQGRFLPLEVGEQGIHVQGPGQLCVQICLTIPDDLVLASLCCRLRLELVKRGMQVCSCNLLLASRDLEAEMVELEGWAMHPACPPSEVCHLLDDMAEWLSFQHITSPAALQSYNSGDGTGNALPDAPAINLLEASLKKEAQRPEMMQMMALVGLDLLQLAVHTGSVKLANRILSGLLAPPLNLPFTPLALGQEHCVRQAATADAQAQQRRPVGPQQALQQQQQQQQRGGVDGRQPGHTGYDLLSLSLQSCSPKMLMTVLEWGHTLGCPDSLWAWKGAGECGPLHIVQQLPSGHPMLMQLQHSRSLLPEHVQRVIEGRQDQQQQHQKLHFHGMALSRLAWMVGLIAAVVLGLLLKFREGQLSG